MNIKKLADKYFKLYFYFLVFFLPVVFIQKCEDAYYLPKLALLAGGAQFLVISLFGGARKLFRPVDWAVTAFVFLYPLGIIHAADKAAALIKCGEWACAAGVFLYASHFLKPADIKKAFILMMASAVLVSLYAVFQSFSMDLKGWVTNFSGRVFSSLGNPDFLGGFLVLVIPLCAAVKNRFSPYLFIFFSMVLVLSQTRSSLAALAAAAVVLAIMMPGYFRENYRVLAAGAAACILILLLSGTGVSLAKRAAGSFTAADSGISGRAEMWKTGLNMIGANFFTGTGAGCINNVYPLYSAGKIYIETAHLHNDFIEVFAESGAAAFGAFLIFLALAAIAAAGAKGWLQKAPLAVFAAMAVQAFFNFPFSILDSKLYFFAIAGMAGASAAGESRAGAGAVDYAAAAVSAAAVSCVAVFLAGSIYLNRVIVAAQPGMASADIARAVQLYPYSRKYYYAAEVAFRTNDINDASAASADYLETDRYSKLGAIQSGIIAAESGNLDRALQLFEDFLKRYPSDVDMLNNYGKALFLKGDIAEAVGVYYKAVGLDPGNEVAHKNLEGIFNSKGMKAGLEKEDARWKNLIRK